MTEVTLCQRCILSSRFPKITFNVDSICNYCQESPSPDIIRQQRLDSKLKMEAALNGAKGNNEYDCVVAFSGGKDSSYTLINLVQEYQLRCLAVTIDNGFIDPKAIANCQAVTGSLGVDWVLFRPHQQFMFDMYKKSVEDPSVHAKAAIKRASNICNSCINLINNHMVKTALQTQAPMIAGGYIGGQVPKDSVFISVDLQLKKTMKEYETERMTKSFGEHAHRYFGLENQLIENYRHQRLLILNPMLAVVVTEQEIREKIGSYGWQSVESTGKHSTNCRLNDLGIFTHYKQHGFHPYVFELAEQVRMGVLSRSEALDKVQSIPAWSEVKHQAEQIGLEL